MFFIDIISSAKISYRPLNSSTIDFREFESIVELTIEFSGCANVTVLFDLDSAIKCSKVINLLSTKEITWGRVRPALGPAFGFACDGGGTDSDAGARRLLKLGSLFIITL
jgi:hypothetical protein